MQFNVTTDYAIRTVLYLGQCKKRASTTEIAKEMGIPRGYLEKVLSKLKKAEYISANLGTKGGYSLNKSLKEITLGDVIRIMENTTKINRCLDKLKKAEYISANLGTKGGYSLNKSLKEITLGDVIRIMENTTKINRCLEQDNFCNRNAADFCAVRKYYVRVQKELEEKFFNVSLEEIIKKA